MGKKPSSSTELKDDRKKDVNLCLQPQKYIKINIFILTLIVLLLLGTQIINHSSKSKEQVQKQQLKLSIERSKQNLQLIEKNCPTILQDNQSCKTKLHQCFKTDQQFKQANLQMSGAIKQCQAVNTQNAVLNEKINSQIKKMDDILKTLQ